MSEDRRLDLILSALFLALGIYIILAARGLQSLPGLPVGPGLFPTITGIGMVGFAALLGLQSLLGRGAGPVEAPDLDDGPDGLTGELLTGAEAAAEAEPPPVSGFWGRRFLLVPFYGIAVCLIILATIHIMPWLGFRLTAFLMTAAIVLAGGGSWRQALIFSAIMVLLIYAMFRWGFRVQLPIGIWG